ncbi:HSF-type DNA-binding-domain-containing protein [Absidia repens]|uniref:HSF-type DNA-binding-domain-containing protein n=1 Tax=Absidia repens TaxID=90262 RepID=A0A1X2IR28_9FUNG|nr:HSF-type DNA-binding-domain-containing protein [Absidia repens]
MESYRHPDADLTNFSAMNPSLNMINTTTTNPSSNLTSNSTSTSDNCNNNKPAHTNTFVHKLFNMVLDEQYQHLIAWNYTGSSFIVCNIMEFSKDVLPKHFKHNNFSSFVRISQSQQITKGHRTLAENQIWEFSHTKFLRGRADLLDDIKRKAMETDTRNQTDIQSHLTMMQMTQSDIIQQINRLFENFNQVVNELADTKKKMASQSMIIKQLANYISQQNGGQLPVELNLEGLSLETSDTNAPSIFVTSHESTNNSNNGSNNSSNLNIITSSDQYNYHQQQQYHHHPFQQQHQYSPSPVPPSPLTVRTQSSPPRSPHYQQQYNTHSPIVGLSPLSSTFATSLSSTPTGLMASDDDTLYSPHTPTDSNSSRPNSTATTTTTDYDPTVLHHHQCK